MNSLEKHSISEFRAKPQAVTNENTGAPELIVSAKAQDSSKKCKKAAVESKKTNELAVVLFSNQVPLKAKSMLTYSVNKTDLSFYTSSAKLFKRYAKIQAEMVAFEVKAERAGKINEEHWTNIKNAFNERLKSLDLKRHEKYK